MIGSKFFAVFLIASLTASAAMAGPIKPYHEVARWTLGGDGSWDYIAFDGTRRRVYVARSDRFMVVDADTGKLTGELKGLTGAHGVAFAKEKGYATSGKSNEVFVFSPDRLKVIRKIKVGENPDAIIFDGGSNSIFAFNGQGNNVSVIDPETDEVSHTIPLSGTPEFAVSDGKGRVFVNIENKDEITVINTKKFTVTDHFKLDHCAEPGALALDATAHRLFVGCGGGDNALVVSSEDGKIYKSLTVGTGTDAAVFDPQLKLAFIAAGEGKMSAIGVDANGEYSVVQTVSTQKGARTLTLDPKTGKVFLATASFGPLEPLKPGQKKPRPSLVAGSFVILVEGN